MRVANPSAARIQQRREDEKGACNWRSAGCAPGSAGAQRRVHEWQKSAGISYPEFSFGAVNDRMRRRRRRRRVESNSAALPSSGASLHPPVPVRCVCPGRRMWCWRRREGNRGRTPSVSAHPTAGGRVEEDEAGGGVGKEEKEEEEEKRKKEGFSRSETGFGKAAPEASLSATHRASEDRASPPLQGNFHHRSHHQRPPPF